LLREHQCCANRCVWVIRRYREDDVEQAIDVHEQNSPINSQYDKLQWALIATNIRLIDHHGVDAMTLTPFRRVTKLVININMIYVCAVATSAIQLQKTASDMIGRPSAFTMPARL
jgi:hypothetical protein